MTLLTWLIKIKLAGFKGSSKKILSICVSLAGMILVFGPGIFSAVYRIIVSGGSDVGYQQTTSLFSSAFLAWVIVGAVFQIHFAWQIDWAKTLRLPLRLSQVYLTKHIFGLIGPWLIIFLPAWIWLAVSQAESPAAFALLLVAIVEFVILANQATGILSYFIGDLDRSVLRILVIYGGMIILSILMFAALRAAFVQDDSILARLGRLVVSFQKLSIWEFLPGALIARAFRSAAESDLVSLAASLGLLTLAVLIGGAVELWTIRKKYLVRESRFNAGERAGRSSLLGLLSLMGMGPRAALLLKDIKIFFSYKPFIYIFLFIAAYAPVFIIFVPPSKFFFVELMCIYPFFMFAHLKGNLLGPDVTSLKNVFSMPANLINVLRVKSAALNTLLLAVIAATISAGLISGNLALSASETIILALCLISQFYFWNILGVPCSVFFPDPVDAKGATQGEGPAAPGLLLFFCAPVLLGVFALVQKLGEHFNSPVMTIAVCLTITVSMIAFYYLWLIPFLKGRLRERRDSLYLTMSKNL